MHFDSRKSPNAAFVNVQLLARRTEVEVCIGAKAKVSGSSSQSPSARTVFLGLAPRQGKGNEKLYGYKIRQQITKTVDSLGCPSFVKTTLPEKPCFLARVERDRDRWCFSKFALVVHMNPLGFEKNSGWARLA